MNVYLFNERERRTKGETRERKGYDRWRGIKRDRLVNSRFWYFPGVLDSRSFLSRSGRRFPRFWIDEIGATGIWNFFFLSRLGESRNEGRNAEKGESGKFYSMAIREKNGTVTRSHLRATFVSIRFSRRTAGTPFSSLLRSLFPSNFPPRDLLFRSPFFLLLLFSPSFPRPENSTGSLAKVIVFPHDPSLLRWYTAPPTLCLIDKIPFGRDKTSRCTLPRYL